MGVNDDAGWWHLVNSVLLEFTILRSVMCLRGLGVFVAVERTGEGVGAIVEQDGFS